MKLNAGLFLVLLVTWLVWSGHYTAMLIGFGVASVVFVVGVARRMDVVDHEGMPLHLTAGGFLYFPWLLWQIVLANIDVVKRVLRGPSAVSPTLFEATASQKTELGLVLFANSITLTPGTVSIIVEPGRILVHAISREGAEDLMGGEMDRRCTLCEGVGDDLLPSARSKAP